MCLDQRTPECRAGDAARRLQAVRLWQGPVTRRARSLRRTEARHGGHVVTGCYSVAVVAGDGIGPEVLPAAITAVDAVAAQQGFSVRWTEYPWGSDHYREHGRMMPADGLDLLAGHDAILLGAVGAPD